MWNWAGLVAAAAVYLLAILTLGAGLLLAPVALGVSLWSLRRADGRVAPWAGVAASVVLTLGAIYVFAAALFGET